MVVICKMRYRIVDYTSCRGDFSVDGDEIIESSPDISEVAKDLLKDRFQEMYNNYEGSDARDGYLKYCCEFYSADPMNDSVWCLGNGEEQSRFLISEESEFFSYKFPETRVFSWPDDGIFELYENTDWGNPVHSFETLTGLDPYKVGWDNFDCAQVLIESGIIKETV